MSYSPARIDEQPKTEPELEKNAENKAKPLTPGWFSEAYPIETPEALAERYRTRAVHQDELQKSETAALEEYRRKLDERIQFAQRLYDPPMNDNPPTTAARQRRPTLPLAEISGRRKRYRMEQAEFAERQDRKSHGIGTYLIYATLAVLIGSGAGFGVANRTQVLGFATAGYQKAKDYAAWKREPAQPAVVLADTAGETTIPKKPITMASLAVADVRGTLNSMIPLTLQTTPASVDQTLDLKITGLPKTAYLTKGSQTVSGEWVVKAAEAENINLFVPQSETPKLNLEVAAVDSGTNTIATPAQSMSVELSDVKITPTAAPPDGVEIKSDAIATPIIPGADLLLKAQQLMNQGDIASARQYYLQAAALGNAKGTFGVARTYDPEVFAELKIEGLQPDPIKADEWYKKAAAAGITAQN
jgi:hypothetical protein